MLLIKECLFVFDKLFSQILSLMSYMINSSNISWYFIFIQLYMKQSFCLQLKISITTEPVEFFIQWKLLIGSWMYLVYIIFISKFGFRLFSYSQMQGAQPLVKNKIIRQKPRLFFIERKSKILSNYLGNLCVNNIIFLNIFRFLIPKSFNK